MKLTRKDAVICTFLFCATVGSTAVLARNTKLPRSLASSSDEFFSEDPYKDIAISFLDHGKPVANKTKAQLMSEIPPQEKKLYEYHEDGYGPEGTKPEGVNDHQFWVNYGLLPANQVLDSIFGDAWRKAEPGSQLVFTCVDNYQPAVPVERFLKYDGYFAVYRKDGRPTDAKFSIRNRFESNKILPIGPLFLTWDGMENPEVLRDGKNAIPYQIMSINLVGKEFGKIAVASDAPERVSKGAEAFRNYCFNCHRVNGSDGGARGPDLGSIANAYAGREGVLAQFILDPRIQHPGTTMEPLSATYKGAPEQLRPTVDFLIDFLKDSAARSK